MIHIARENNQRRVLVVFGDEQVCCFAVLCCVLFIPTSLQARPDDVLQTLNERRMRFKPLFDLFPGRPYF